MGLLARLRGRRAEPPVELDPSDASLVLLVSAPDAARADSEVLAEAQARGVDLSGPLLIRHHLVGLAEPAVAQAAELLADDGYAVLPGVGGEVLAVRTQVLTALSASQERSRMAGLAQRLGGDVRGWDALGRPPAHPR